MSLHFTMSPAQIADLDRLLAAQQDRRSPHYHKFLTPEEYAARFRPASSDISKVIQWLEESGFSAVQVARGGMWVSFSGTAAQAEAAFHVSLHNYSLQGETHFANSSDPQPPKALAGFVSNVRGLHNFPWQSYARQPHPQYNLGGTNYLAPDDWATIYDLKPLYGAGIDGTGVTIAVVGEADVQLSDLRAFRAAAGLPSKDPTIIVPPGSTDPGNQTYTPEEAEADLDLEWAGAIARNASILFVTASATTGNGVLDAIAYVIDNNAAPIMTISYGDCEANQPSGFITSEEVLFQQASAQGISVLAASGDGGATTCDARLNEAAATKGLAVSYPASSAYVTAVGGTELNSAGYYWSSTNNGYGGSALSYIPETVWNEAFQVSGGGGASKKIPKPAWQTGTGVPSDNARDVPDVAFSAAVYRSPYLICGNGSCTNGFLAADNSTNRAGGTSASTPFFAGLLALVLQKGGGNRLGNINPNLYSLAQISNNAFHDITSGNNLQICQSGTPDCTTTTYIGYDAVPGYDLASGLGSVDAFNFAQQWFGDFTVAANPTSITIQPGSSATATVSVAPQNNFSGQVTVTCSVDNSLIDVACSVPSGTIGPNGTTTVSITAATTAQTPFWKHIRTPSPLKPGSLLVFLSPLLLVAVPLYRARKKRPIYRAYLYFLSSSLLALIAIGSVRAFSNP